MNIAVMQSVSSTVQAKNLSTVGSSNKESGTTFGSVFNRIVESGTSDVVTAPSVGTEQTTDENIVAIFDSNTIVGLAEALGVDLALSEKVDSASLEQLAELLGIDSKQLVDNILQLLENSGLSQIELATAITENDFRTILNAIDNNAHQFFSHLADGLEGKGFIPKEQAVELLAFLKAVPLVALNTDLHVKVEQQVFSLQSSIAIIGEQFENNLKQTVVTRPGNMVFTQNIVSLVVQPDASKNAATGDGNPKSTSDETVILNGSTGNLSVTKGEIPTSELENRNNARNEALLREMQNVFKRSNFGQTGGTNRLLIKLYPEHLGQVRIELVQTNGVLTARILASTALGKEMLDSQLHQLRAAFLQQNLQVERIDISQTLQDTSRNDRDQAFNQHFRKEQEDSNEQQEQKPDEEMTFQEYMIELEA